MAANFSEYLSKKILDHILAGGPALPIYTEMWVAIFHDSTGTTEANLRNNNIFNEITDANYARIHITTTGAATFNLAIAGTTGMNSITNIDLAYFGAAAPYPNSVKFIALMDALTNGNVLAYSSITTTSVALGEYIKILASDFTVNL